MYNISITSNLKEILGRLQAGMKRRPERISRALAKAADEIVDQARTVYLTGGALHVQTGHLRRSVKRSPVRRTGKREFQVDIGTNVWYGRAWEEGFTVPAHTITPQNSTVLRFVSGSGDVVYAKRANMPARTEPARPWLGPSIEDKRPRVEQLLNEVGIEVFQ